MVYGLFLIVLNSSSKVTFDLYTVVMNLTTYYSKTFDIAKAREEGVIYYMTFSVKNITY